MKILISGASGLIGNAIKLHFSKLGYQVIPLQRKEPSRPPYWSIEKEIIDLGEHKSIDVVIHLAGENIAAGRWTKKKKEKIKNSRIKGTKLLCEYISTLKHRPKTLISASAIGYYGDRGDEELTEDSPKGSGFLAEVCECWENATQLALKSSIRVINMRLGMVLSPQGGALKKMLLPFKLGLGGIIGSGHQYISWIAIADVLGAIDYIITHEKLIGPINFVSPYPVTNKYFTKTLAKLLHRPSVVPLPSPVAKLFFGEMAKELLLSSTKVVPKKLIESGYPFKYSQLEDALKAILQQSNLIKIK